MFILVRLCFRLKKFTITGLTIRVRLIKKTQFATGYQDLKPTMLLFHKIKLNYYNVYICIFIISSAL